MKRALPIVVLALASFGVFADEFDDFVGKMRRGADQSGVQLRADRERRTIFFDFKLPAEVTSASSEELAEFKKEFIKSFRSSSQGKAVVVMKRINASFCINLILTNGKVYRVRIAPDEM